MESAINDQKWTEGNFKANVKVEKGDAPRRAVHLLAMDSFHQLSPSSA